MHDPADKPTQAPPKKDPREVTVRPVDQILAGAADPRKPSAALVAEALLSLQRQVLLVNNNQGILQRQHAKLAAAIDRATDALFDKTDGAGGITHGVASAVHALYEKVGGMENATSNYMLFSAAAVEFLRAGLPKLIADNDGKYPTEKQCAECLDAIMTDMKRQGDEAAANRLKLEKAVEGMVNCAFCKHWCKKTGLIVPGQEQKVECDQDFVQLSCARCMQMCPQPVPPMNIGDVKCGACGGELQREATDDNGIVRTLCGLFDFDSDRGREAIIRKGFTRDEALAAFPVDVSPIEKNVGGAHEPTIGVAEIPPGETRPLTP